MNKARGYKNPHSLRSPSYWCAVPRHEIEALARCLLPDIRAYFESEEGQREYAAWEAAKEHKK